MKSQVATTVSGRVFAYPTVVSVPPTAAQDAPRLDADADRSPLWPIEFATAA